MRSGVALMYAFNQRVTPDGRKRVDLVDRYGSIVRNAYVMSGAGMPVNVPLEKDVAIEDYTSYPVVVVGFMQGDSTPIVLGSLDCTGIKYTNDTDTDTKYDFSEEEPRLTDDADTNIDESKISMEEVVLASPRGGRLILKHNGAAVLAGTCISLQIPVGSYIRLSRNGDTSGRVPLVQPLVNLLDEMGSKINDLQAEVASLRSTLFTSFSINLDGLTFDPNTGTVLTNTPTFPLITANILDVGLSTSTALQPIDGDTISSATLRISSDTEG